MQKIFDEATASLETPIDRLNQFERREIVEQLNEQGLLSCGMCAVKCPRHAIADLRGILA